jgi:hypothetical protein
MSHKPGGGLHSKNVSHVSAPKQEPTPHRASPAGAAQIGVKVAFKKEEPLQGKGYATPQGPTQSVAGPGGGRTVYGSGSQHGLRQPQAMPEGRDTLAEFGPEMTPRTNR